DVTPARRPGPPGLVGERRVGAVLPGPGDQGFVGTGAGRARHHQRRDRLPDGARRGAAARDGHRHGGTSGPRPGARPARTVRTPSPTRSRSGLIMAVTGIFLFVLIAGMAIGMPIAHALLLTGAALMWHLDFFDSQLIAQNLLAGFDSFPLLAVPFFILAGELMNAGGLSRRIIDLARAFVGHIQGGLGYVAIAAAVLLAAMS